MLTNTGTYHVRSAGYRIHIADLEFFHVLLSASELLLTYTW